MSSKSDICNLALLALGVTRTLTNVDTETSDEALACRRWYQVSLDFVLEDFDWNFARRRVALAELDIESSVWSYVYAYPSECAKPRRIEIEGVRTPYAEQRIPFKTGGETTQSGDIRVIYTDQEAAVLVYTKKITDAGLFDAHFVLALTFLLATNIAMSLTVDQKLAANAGANYRSMKLTAFASDLNEGQDDPEPMGETERARNG